MIRRKLPAKTNGKVKQWNEDRPRQAYMLALLGLTDEEMAGVMGIAENTLEYWKRTRPDFLTKLNDGKIIADARAVEGLYKRATGFEKEEVVLHMYKGRIIKTRVMKYYPPDAWAANKWASIRQRSKWADVQKIETTHTNININKFDFTGLSNEELMVLKKAGMKQLQEHVGSN